MVISHVGSYPVFGITKTIYAVFSTDLFVRISSQLVWETFSHLAIISRRLFVHLTYSEILIYTAE